MYPKDSKSSFLDWEKNNSEFFEVNGGVPTLPDIFYYFKCILSLSKYSLDIEKSIKYIRDFVISLFPITIF